MRKPIRCLTLIAALCLVPVTSALHAAENDISLPGGFLQPSFDTLVDELGMAVAYNPFSPAEPLGITGFEIGASVSMVEIDQATWDQVVGDGSAPSRFPVPRLMARKGLPFGFDVGATYTSVPSSDITIVGGELRKALLEGSMATPAVSVLGHFSNLNGVDDLDLSTYGVDLGISKGFAMLTPYAGVGQVWYDGSESAGLGLEDREESETRSYVGMRVSFFPLMNLVAQADFANVNSYTLRLNLGF